MGIIGKAEGVNYLSEAQHIGCSQPGPSSYKAEKLVVKPRVTAVKFAPFNGKKIKWKPIKDQGPGVGSYNVENSMK